MYRGPPGSQSNSIQKKKSPEKYNGKTESRKIHKTHSNGISESKEAKKLKKSKRRADSALSESTEKSSDKALSDKKRGRHNLLKKVSAMEASEENAADMVFVGKLSTEAAIRVNASKTHSKTPSSSEQKEKPQDKRPVVDLLTPFLQRKKAGVGSSSSADSLSVEELLEDSFWKDGCRFLLSEVQHSASSEVVDLLHQIFQIQLENDRLESKISQTSGQLEQLKVDAKSLSSSNPLPNVDVVANSSQLPSIPTGSHVPFFGGQLPNGATSVAQPIQSVQVLKVTTAAPSISAPNAAANPPKIQPATPYILPHDIAMQQMQFQQLYHHLYQQQLQQMHQQQQQQQQQPPLKVEAGAPSSNSATAALSAISTSTTAQRAFPLKLVEPAPILAQNTSNQSHQIAPPEGLLVPPPPPLLHSVTSSPSSTLTGTNSNSSCHSSGSKKNSLDTKPQLETASS